MQVIAREIVKNSWIKKQGEQKAKSKNEKPNDKIEGNQEAETNECKPAGKTLRLNTQTLQG